MHSNHVTLTHIDLCFSIFIAFFEGGRITHNDMHYVREGENLVPAGETPFAKDTHFGFKSSLLTDWIIEKFEKSEKNEKSGGKVSRNGIKNVNVDTIRDNKENIIADKLLDRKNLHITVDGEYFAF